MGGRLETGSVDDPEDVEHGNAAHGVVAPFVGRLDQSTNETSDDHNQVKEDGDEDGREGKAGNEENLEEKERGGDGPVNVTSVPDGTGGASTVDLGGAVVGELDADGGSTQVGSHGEVGDGSGGQDGGGEVVEGALTARNLHGPDHGGQASQGHDREDSPEPVGAMSGDVDVSDSGVDGEGLVARSLEQLCGGVHVEKLDGSKVVVEKMN